MVKKMLEVVVNYLYPALTTVKTDWLFLCTPASVMFAASRPLPSPRMPLLSLPLTKAFSTYRSPLLTLRLGPGNGSGISPALPIAAPEASPPGPPRSPKEAAGDPGPSVGQPACYCGQCGSGKPLRAPLTTACRIYYGAGISVRIK